MQIPYSYHPRIEEKLLEFESPRTEFSDPNWNIAFCGGMISLLFASFLFFVCQWGLDLHFLCYFVETSVTPSKPQEKRNGGNTSYKSRLSLP